MPPRKTRRVDSETTTAATTTIFFADAGNVQWPLKGHIIPSRRLPADDNLKKQISEVAEEVAPDIMVSPAQVKTKHTDWHLVSNEWVEVSST